MKQQKYTGANGKDLIDRWEEKHTIRDFRLIIGSVMERYIERIGRKDDAVQEVEKLVDYAQRWLEVEKRNKQNQVDTAVENFKRGQGLARNELGTFNTDTTWSAY